jgi:hypothetical protein
VQIDRALAQVDLHEARAAGVDVRWLFKPTVDMLAGDRAVEQVLRRFSDSRCHDRRFVGRV